MKDNFRKLWKRLSSGSTRGLWIIGAARLTLIVAWVTLTVLIIYKVAERGSPRPALTAATPLHANQRIEPGDLRIEGDETLIGRYLLTDVAPGAPVLPDMVKAARTRERGPNALAVVVNVPTANAANLVVNLPVTLIRPGWQPIEYGEVIAKECDARTCSLTISLPPRPSH
jgi:hypothetical protein